MLTGVTFTVLTAPMEQIVQVFITYCTQGMVAEPMHDKLDLDSCTVCTEANTSGCPGSLQEVW